jgi:hypothetical protein
MPGGNGILPEKQVGLFVADAEATTPTRAPGISTLIVGRAIPGTSTFG